VLLGGVQLPVLHLVGGVLLRLPLPLAVAVDVGVGQDPVQPGLEVGALGELVEGGVGLHERLLDQVLGVGRVAGHPQGRRVELVEIGQRVPLEPGVALGAGLLGVGAAAALPCLRDLDGGTENRCSGGLVDGAAAGGLLGHRPSSLRPPLAGDHVGRS